MSSIPMGSNPLVSIVVPTKNSARTLGACLQSLRQQSYTPIEIVVVDNFSHDDTMHVARKYADVVLQQGPERSAQRNTGVAVSKGEYVLIIDSDMKLSADVVRECVKCIHTHKETKCIVIPEESFGQGLWAQCKKLERSFYVGVDWMEAARFFAKKIYEEMYGYDDTIVGAEDYDLPQRIEQKYGKSSVGRIHAYIYHDEGNLSLWRSCQKKFYYAQTIRTYLAKNANRQHFSQQSNIFARYWLFFKQPGKLFKNPIIGLCMLFMKSMEMMSSLCGYVWGKYMKIENIYK